ncbi:MAG: leucine-rich repeat protein [Bacilli bacterium]|nr:leucine-rich repeat protein [Bacilli bacterium]
MKKFRLKKKYKNIFSTIKSSFFCFTDKVKNIDKLKDKKFVKSISIIIITLFLLTQSFSWMYDEYVGSGAVVGIGSIQHQIAQYDQDGNLIEEDSQTHTLLYETNMSNMTKNTKFIEIKNTGSLDMEYSLTFDVEGDIGETGVLYYRLYEVTEDVYNSSLTGELDTKIKSYAHNNPIASNIETDTARPIVNFSLLKNVVQIGQVHLEGNEATSVYYRLDYGMYSNVNTSLYSGKSLSVHFNVYSSQLGTITNENNVGQVINVENEEQLRAAMSQGYPGDTIKLLGDIEINGTLNFSKRINLDLNGYLLKVTGDLVYDFVSLGELKIDTSGEGRLEVLNDLYINAPKASVVLVGENKAYDIVVGNIFKVNGLQDGEEDGVLLDNVRIVKSSTNFIPADIVVLSNTRLTIGPEVELGFVTANPGSTNIEVVNNGTVSQMQFQDMTLLTTFTKPQIYVYNLGTISGVVGSTGILLPSTSVPYLGTNQGNTLIVRGITSSDITVSGSDEFDSGDIEENEEGSAVIPIEGEEDSYYVYIKDSTSILENLLRDYFNLKDYDPVVKTSAIKKLIIYTINGQYLENEDFDFLNSNKIPNISYLSLANTKVKDDTILNRIKTSALDGKTSLKNVILPKTVEQIGANAFRGIALGYIPASMAEEFNFLVIPSSVTKIEALAFDATKYVKFASSLPPVDIALNSFNLADDGGKFFVPSGAIETYKQDTVLNDANIFRTGDLSDNRKYIVYEVGSNIGISYLINTNLTSNTLGIPNTLVYKGVTSTIISISENAFRHLQIQEVAGVPVTLPTTVLDIGDYAFYERNITSIDLSNVKTIGNYAFYNTKLDRVVANVATDIGNYAFYNTTASTISFNAIENIGNYAFANAANLYEIHFANVKSIGAYAFYDCKRVVRAYFGTTASLLVNNKEEINISVGENAIFSNWGYYIDGRLRVYVPDGDNLNGTKYIDLYKDKFSQNSRYIYVTGIDIGSYTYMGVTSPLSMYTVKQKTITTTDGTVSSGVEIISYQGPDIIDGYLLPESFDIESIAIPTISIGDYAYYNSKVTKGNSFNISNNNLLYVGRSSFEGLNISSIIGDNIREVSDNAFKDSTLHKGLFKKLEKLGSYAFYNNQELYSLNLGLVKSIGSSAVSQVPNLEQLFLGYTGTNINYSANSFSGIGGNIGEHLRIYVPDNATSLAYYKGLISAYVDYIYPTGRIVGHYKHGAIDYDIGEYSIRETTFTKDDNSIVSGWEIIEYHGSDLDSSYTFPETMNPTVDDVNVSQTTTSCYGSYICDMVFTIENNSSDDITDWRLDMATPNGMEIVQYSGGSWDVKSGYVTIHPTSSTKEILMGRTVSVSLRVSSLIPFTNVTFNDFRADMPNSVGLDIISIGDNAFAHTNTVTNSSFDITSNKLLKVGENAFSGIDAIKTVTLPSVEYIGDNAFRATTIAKGTFDSLKTLGNSAFQNTPTLYYLNLGGVKSIEENAISNCPELLQVLFRVDTVNVNFHNNSINNIGTSSNDRLRLYVTNGKNQDGIEYVDLYKSYFNSNLSSYFFAYDYIIGTYTPDGVNSDIDIGEYAIREVTVKNSTNQDVSGYEYVEYHGAAMTSFFEFPTEFEFSDDSLAAEQVGTLSPWGSSGNWTSNISFKVTNVGTSTVENWRLVVDISSAGAVFNIAAWWNGTATLDGTKLIITSNSALAPGASYTASGQVTYGTLSFAPYIRSIKKNTASANAKAVVSIGEYAFSHSIVASGSKFDINSTSLLEIGDGAFKDNDGIHDIIADNVVTIGIDAFRNANSLHYASFKKLETAGSYAFANCMSLAYMHLGYIEEISEGLLNNDKKITQLYILNENSSSAGVMNINVGSGAFTNLGVSVGANLRIYVPSGMVNSTDTYADAYKILLPTALSQYIYESGYLYGSYYYADTDLDIGEYMLSMVTTNGVTGWRIADYHGVPIDSTYQIPGTFTNATGETYDVVSIGDYAYTLANFDPTLVWELVIPSTVNDIGKYSFYQLSMSTLEASGVKTIGKYAFAQAPGLMTVNLKEIVTINEYAFYNITSLTAVVLGSKIATMGNYAFYNTYSANNLTAMYISAVTPPNIKTNTLPGIYSSWWIDRNSPTVYVPYSATSTYEGATYWSRYPVGILGSLYNNVYIYNVINTNQIEITGYIGSSTTVTIPDYFTINSSNYNVTSITDDAFDATTSVRTLNLPRYLVNIGNAFLTGNTSIRTITVNTNNTYFAASSGVLYTKDLKTLIKYPPANTSTSFTMSSTTTVITLGAFDNAKNLRTINLGSGLLAISNNSFTNCTNLNTLQFSTTTPPIITGFSGLPIKTGLSIRVPSSALTTYRSNVFFLRYSSSMVGY